MTDDDPIAYGEPSLGDRWYKCSATPEHLYKRSPKDGSPYAIGSSSVTSVLGRGLETYLHTKWHLHPYSRLAQQTWAKNWGLCSFGERELSNTMWLASRPTSMPSFTLIHSTVWPQYTNVTDRQRCDSIGQTVLQTVAQLSWYASPCLLIDEATVE